MSIYRPEGFVTLSTKNASSVRPGVVSTLFKAVDVTWWKSFGYRAFNIGVTSGTVQASDATALRIYIKIA